MSATMKWPEKTRELHNHHFDSTIWNDLKFRDDDIVIATYAKSGTTWMQQIVAQLMFDGDPDISVAEMSPWVDLRVPPKEVKLPLLEAQTHRRFMKTHLPVDAIRFCPKAKYLYIGRDGRDVVWSMYNHHVNANQTWYDALNDTPGRVGPPIEPPPDDIRQYWREWLDRDGHPFWPFWENIRSWWAVRDLPKRKVHSLRKSQARYGQRDTWYCDVSRHPNQRITVGGHPEALFVRVDEEECHEKRSSWRGVLGRGCRGVHQQGRKRAVERYTDAGRGRRVRDA